MLSQLSQALETGMGLRREHQRVLIRTGWVLIVSGHIAWACGWLASFGLAAPFARAADVDKLLRAAEVNARISMQQEIRVQVRAYCQTTDEEVRLLTLKRIDELRTELWEIAKIQTPAPQCLRGGESAL